MRVNTNRDGELSIGDYCFSRKKISEADYEKFRELSFDYSPIHSNPDYAGNTSFGKPVAPLFLTSAPFSGLVGCGIPGDQALLLKSSVTAEAPIFYGEEIQYSLRVINRDVYGELVSLKALGVRGADIVLSGEVLAKVRSGDPVVCKDSIPRPQIVKNSESKVLVLIGATSKIGQSIALKAAKHGYSLVISFHSDEEKAILLRDNLMKFGSDVLVFSREDLLRELGRSKDVNSWRSRVSGLVTLHSSPIDDSYENLYRTNFSENRDLIDAMLPDLLLRQAGTLINIGTGMMVRGGRDHSAYLHAKLALHNYFEQEAIRLSNSGLQWVTIAPDQVDTNFSKSLTSDIKLLPEQVAEEVLCALDNQFAKEENFSWVRNSGARRGRFGGFNSCPPSKVALPVLKVNDQEDKIVEQTDSANKAVDEDELFTRVREIVESVLGFEVGAVSSDGIGVGQTAGWDSARHLEIIMNVEDKFNLKLQTSDYADVETVRDIVDLVSKRA